MREEIMLTIVLLVKFYIWAASGFEETFFTWTPGRGPRNDTLMCPISCKNDIRGFPERCCSCQSKTALEVRQANGESVFKCLYVEYIDIVNTGFVVDNGGSAVSPAFKLIHSHGRLRKLPINMCDYTNIVHLEVTNNLLSSISNLSCLSRLDLLDLSYNRIQFISNETFIQLRFLRYLDLSHNLIKEMQPSAIGNPFINIFHVNLSSNHLKRIDVSDVILKDKLFCSLNYSNSIFGTIERVKTITPDNDIIYGSGDIDLSNNVFQLHPLLVMFRNTTGKSLLGQIQKLCPRGVFKFGNVPITCDCDLAPLLTDISEVGRYFGSNPYLPPVLCNSPEDLKGISIFDLSKNSSFIDKLICDVKRDCPSKCLCTEQAGQKRLLVNCTGLGKTHLPEIVPKTQYPVELLMSHNSIHCLEYRNYLPRISVLDLSHNGLTAIQDAAISALRSASHINVVGHEVNQLPERIRVLQPDAIQFGDHPIKCDCSNIWIREWRRLKNANSSNALVCITDKGVKKNADLVDSEFLGCETDTDLKPVIAGLSSLLGISGIVFILIGCFRWEIAILIRSVRNRFIVRPRFIADIYLSYLEDDNASLEFTTRILKPMLEEKGYVVFTALHNALPGSSKEESATDLICKSKTSVVILTESYIHDKSSTMEYNRIWSLFLKDPTRNVLLIDFDNYSQVHNDRLRGIRALRRFGMYINITDRNRNVYKTLLLKLKKPDFSDESDRITSSRYLSM